MHISSVPDVIQSRAIVVQGYHGNIQQDTQNAIVRCKTRRDDMFKRKIKSEFEVFSEQRYKDAAVVIYHQMKNTDRRMPNENPIIKPPVQGWTNEETGAVSPTQLTEDAPQTSKEIVEHSSDHIQSKFCTVM